MRRYFACALMLAALSGCATVGAPTPPEPAPAATGGRPMGGAVYRGMLEYMIEEKMRALTAPALAPRTRPQTI